MEQDTSEAKTERRDADLAVARVLALIVMALSLPAAVIGLAARGGSAPASVTSSWNAEVRLDGQGIYRRDSASGAAQERAQDVITLAYAVPLIGLAAALAKRKSMGGRMLLSGSFGYFMYCYGMMSVGSSYNELFLAYVALFAVSLWGFILSLSSQDPDKLAAVCAKTFPRKSAAALTIAVAAFLGINWIFGVVLPALLGSKAPSGLEAYTTLFVQAIDLAILVPACIVSAVWLLRRDPRGYVLAGAVMVKGSAEGLAVLAMGINMIRTGAATLSGSWPFLAGMAVLSSAAVLIGLKAVKSAGFSGMHRAFPQGVP